MKKWYKLCPYCWEEIKEIAKKCRFCWEFLEEEKEHEIKYEYKCECGWIVEEWDKKCIHCGAELEWGSNEQQSDEYIYYPNKNAFSFKKLKNDNWKFKRHEEKIKFSQRLLYFIPNVILLRISFSLCYASIWVMHDLISRGNWIWKVPIYMSGFSFLFGVSVIIWIFGVIWTTKKKLYSWTVKASIWCFIFSLIVYCARVNTFEENKKKQQLMLREQNCKEQWYSSCYERDLKIRQREKKAWIR